VRLEVKRSARRAKRQYSLHLLGCQSNGDPVPIGILEKRCLEAYRVRRFPAERGQNGHARIDMSKCHRDAPLMLDA
jgi:hypothetical protein